LTDDLQDPLRQAVAADGGDPRCVATVVTAGDSDVGLL
jgi:hypothetical protein